MEMELGDIFWVCMIFLVGAFVGALALNGMHHVANSLAEEAAVKYCIDLSEDKGVEFVEGDFFYRLTGMVFSCKAKSGALDIDGEFDVDRDMLRKWICEEGPAVSREGLDQSFYSIPVAIAEGKGATQLCYRCSGGYNGIGEYWAVNYSKSEYYCYSDTVSFKAIQGEGQVEILCFRGCNLVVEKTLDLEHPLEYIDADGLSCRFRETTGKDLKFQVRRKG